MSQDIDTEIARLEQQIESIKRKKLTSLQAELAKLTAGYGSAPAAPARAAAAPAAEAPRRRGRKPGSKNKKKPAAAAAAPSAKKSRRGGRKPKFNDSDAIARLRKAVSAAGPDGISARGAGEAAGIFYPRAIKLMQDNFKKHGSGKWTRYTL